MDRHAKTLAAFAHPAHEGEDTRRSERNTLRVVLLTLVTMAVEVGAGWWTGSMALLADGWHMGTHAFALGISYAAYRLARAYRRSEAFSFGTGKFGELAGYTSALFLGTAGVWIFAESLGRLVHPVGIAYGEAILIAVLGLIVNAASLLILGAGHDHAHGHGHNHPHHHADNNYKAAYLHVLADALTSVMAIAALLGGRFLGWAFLDPVIGLVGGTLICKWAFGLLKATGATLLDAGQDRALVARARALAESDGDTRVADLHLWRIGAHETALILSVVSGRGLCAEDYRERFKDFPELAHINVEVIPCRDPDCPCR